MNTAELERRREVWQALSDVFLDTETRWYFPRIALTLVRSRYSARELERIWRFEVVPECAWNLHVVAGEWAIMPLDEAALIRRARAEPSWLARQKVRFSAGPLAEQWLQILGLRERLLTRVEHRQAAYAAVWSAMAQAYLEESLQSLLFPDQTAAELQDAGLSRAECQATFHDDFRPIYSRLLLGNVKQQEATRAANVLELIARAFV